MVWNCCSHKCSDDDFPSNDYKWYDITFVTVGMLLYLLDWGSDMFIAYTHWQHGDVKWFALTVLFICLPSVVTTCYSIYMYYTLESESDDQDVPNAPKPSRIHWALRIISLIFQLGLLMRYIDTLYYGCRSRHHWKNRNEVDQQRYYTAMVYENSDKAQLCLFEGFMESAPQLILQLYILAQGRQYDSMSEYCMIWLGCLASLMSLAWCLTAHARTSRTTNPDKINLSKKVSFIVFVWHFFLTGARVIAMVLFAVRCKEYFFIGLVVHWLCMVIWLTVKRSLKHEDTSLIKEATLIGLLGYVYLFSFINTQDEPTRIKYIIYYTIWIAENMLMVVLWLVYGDNYVWFYSVGPIICFVSLVLGFAMMGLNYGYLHPTKREERRQRNNSREMSTLCS